MIRFIENLIFEIIVGINAKNHKLFDPKLTRDFIIAKDYFGKYLVSKTKMEQIKFNVILFYNNLL